jgi:starvation-inducible DNA-binding protein
MEPEIESPGEKSVQILEFLELMLADEYVLAVRTRDARRNVYGRNVTGLRKLFREHCKCLNSAVVDMEGRARSLGRRTPATFAHYMKATRLYVHNEKLTGQKEIIGALLEDHQSVIRSLAGARRSRPGSDFLEFVTPLLDQHIRMVDTLREWLQ